MCQCGLYTEGCTVTSHLEGAALSLVCTERSHGDVKPADTVMEVVEGLDKADDTAIAIRDLVETSANISLKCGANLPDICSQSIYRKVAIKIGNVAREREDNGKEACSTQDSNAALRADDHWYSRVMQGWPCESVSSECCRAIVCYAGVALHEDFLDAVRKSKGIELSNAW